MTGYDPDLSEQAWNDALNANRHRVPPGLTDEQVAEQFPAVVVAALKGLLGLQVNRIRKQHGHHRSR